MSEKEIRLNGETRTVDAATMSELLAAEGVDTAARGVAVALNGAVLPRGEWDAKALSQGDTVEIVRAMQGG